MTATRASLIAAIGVILATAYAVWTNMTVAAHTMRLPQDFAFVLFTSVAGGLGWTLFLLTFHDDHDHITARVRRTAVIAGWLIFVEIIAPPLYFFLVPTRIGHTPLRMLTVRYAFYYAVTDVPAVVAVVLFGAFAFSRSIWLIRAASLAFALVDGAYRLFRLRTTRNPHTATGEGRITAFAGKTTQASYRLSEEAINRLR